MKMVKILEIYNKPFNQGMTPITKIEIVIPIPIFIRNWDRNRDPDHNLKKYQRSDRDRSSAIADLFSDLLKVFMQNWRQNQKFTW